MPPRYMTWAIVAFWLGTSSWLFYRDVRPRLWPGGAPPYVIDLTEEAQSNIQTSWMIYRNGQTDNSGYCKTKVVYHRDDDTFELNGEFHLWMVPRRISPSREADLVINSMYRITREGRLREFGAALTANVIAAFPVEGIISGKVQGGLFAPEVKVTRPIEFSQKLKPVAVSETGSVLNPLQPLNRLPGLRKGQRWEVPLVDPLSDLAHKYLKEVTGAMATPQLRVLRAEVLPQTQLLEWKRDDKPVSCLVIEYHGDDTTAKTWVRESDGVVLRQEITQDRETLVLVRE